MRRRAQSEGNTRVLDQPAPSAAAEEIAGVAYERFEPRGNVHGFDQPDWFEAERIVRVRRRGRRGG